MTTPALRLDAHEPQHSSVTLISPFMSANEVRQVVPIALSTLLVWAAAGKFPAPLAMGHIRANGRAAKCMWVRTEVMEWVEAQLAKPRLLGPKAQAVQA
ncbi:helix-turn-helix transcriptional regulator [Pseudomonas sp. AP-1]|uniref:helix-turn-helix transcriptional regulator n=1 Tax=Pseudomonas sp. AP-1 TaxID=3231718 RepID=UPI0035B2463F